jgi:hypothetical protein
MQIHDIPDFIGGDLKTQTQHIIVTHTKINPSETQSKSTRGQDLPSPRQSLQTPLLTASALLHIDLENGQNNTTEASISHHYDTCRIPREGNYMKKLYKNPNKMSVSEGNIPQLIEQERFRASSTFVSLGGRPLPQLPTNKGLKLDLSSKTKQQPRKSRRKHDGDSKELNSSSSSNELDFSQVRYSESNDHFSGDINDRPGRPSSLNLLQASKSGTSWPSRTRSVDETCLTSEHSSFDGEDSTDGIEGSRHQETLQIHMYILVQGSPMFAFIKSTWNNCILVRN